MHYQMCKLEIVEKMRKFRPVLQVEVALKIVSDVVRIASRK